MKYLISINYILELQLSRFTKDDVNLKCWL